MTKRAHKKDLKVKCVICKKEFSATAGKIRPFCSERCKMIDLGNWFDGSYSIDIPSLDIDEELGLEKEENPKGDFSE